MGPLELQTPKQMQSKGDFQPDNRVVRFASAVYSPVKSMTGSDFLSFPSQTLSEPLVTLTELKDKAVVEPSLLLMW